MPQRQQFVFGRGWTGCPRSCDAALSGDNSLPRFVLPTKHECKICAHRSHHEGHCPYNPLNNPTTAPNPEEIQPYRPVEETNSSSTITTSTTTTAGPNPHSYPSQHQQRNNTKKTKSTEYRVKTPHLSSQPPTLTEASASEKATKKVDDAAITQEPAKQKAQQQNEELAKQKAQQEKEELAKQKAKLQKESEEIQALKKEADDLFKENEERRKSLEAEAKAYAELRKSQEAEAKELAAKRKALEESQLQDDTKARHQENLAAMKKKQEQEKQSVAKQSTAAPPSVSQPSLHTPMSTRNTSSTPREGFTIDFSYPNTNPLSPAKPSAESPWKKDIFASTGPDRVAHPARTLLNGVNHDNLRAILAHNIPLQNLLLHSYGAKPNSVPLETLINHAVEQAKHPDRRRLLIQAIVQHLESSS